jgi:hypothetical protein
MARAHRALYQAKVAQAVQDATAKKYHSEKVYTFVVDYGQNMELPSYNSEQLTVFNLGVVNHAHTYNDGRVSEYMHVHCISGRVGLVSINFNSGKIFTPKGSHTTQKHGTLGQWFPQSG